MLLHKNKLRFFFLIYNILSKILQYKKIGLSYNNFLNYINNISLNFNIISDKNLYFFYALLDIFYFFKIFSKKIIIKKLFLGNLKLFFESASIKNNFFVNFESILRNENIYLFLNFIFKLYFLKYNLKINKKETLSINFNNIKFLNFIFYNLFGKLKINFFLKKNKSINKNDNLFFIYFLINFFSNFYKF